MPKFRRARPRAGETEYGGLVGPTGVPFEKRRAVLNAREVARLQRTAGVIDAKAPKLDRVWYGEGPLKTPAQIEGDSRL